ncbi:EamA family transporter [Pedobacter sp. HMF7647]|uniref:EamA family transporter n=1 Tax=Hufsiella arboris TaxID=2695275 RepID=A0A7K1Y7Z5_9SPHI|nr:EamA family transporter [Hufsiella arboris]
MWIIFSLLGAVSAAIVVILSKAGLKNTESSLGFAIQSVLILVVAWTVVTVRGNFSDLTSIDRKAWIFLIVAGIFTALSSLFTFRALKLGNASLVTALERLSLVFSVIMAVIFLKEKITWQVVIGAALMLGGAVLIAISEKSTDNS